MRFAALRFALATLLWLVARDAAARNRIAVLPLDMLGEVPQAVRSTLDARLRTGLAATGATVVLGPAGCREARCGVAAATRLGCRYVVGGRVTGNDGSYDLVLWLADGHSGRSLARVTQSCEICGLTAVGDKMELAASALRAKVEATARGPAMLSIETDPPGASLFLDDKPLGTSPRALELPGGRRRLTVRASGYLELVQTVTLVAGVQERLRLRLIPLPARQHPGRWAAGWALIGTGAALVAVGVALFALDGRQARCADETGVNGGQCVQRQRTLLPAWLTTISGAAGVLGGSLLVWHGRRVEVRGGPAAVRAAWWF